MDLSIVGNEISREETGGSSEDVEEFGDRKGVPQQEDAIIMG